MTQSTSTVAGAQGLGRGRRCDRRECLQRVRDLGAGEAPELVSPAVLQDDQSAIGQHAQMSALAVEGAM